MELSGVFKKLGADVEDDEALRRKEKLAESSSYLTMSKKSVEDLKNMAVKLGVIPYIYKDMTFDKADIQKSIASQQAISGHKFKVSGFDDYYNTCMAILNTVSAKKLPSRSYLIGAPNGFGKRGFATECLLASLRNGWIAVPYISLNELAEIKTANDKVLMRGLMGLETEIAHQPFNFNTGKYETDSEVVESYYYAMGDKYTDVKSPTVVTGRYSWSEYINAPILICFFSGIESKVVESQTLYTLLGIRAAKGLPTVVMMSTSLDIYQKDPVIGRYVWNEILAYDDRQFDVGRVLHVSTFKRYYLK